MTTNRERVARIISDALSPALLPAGALGLGEGLADALADAGLLAPDLPEPDGDGKVWETSHTMTASEGTTLAREVSTCALVEEPGLVALDTATDYIHLTDDEATDVALALLAAARHARKEPPQC